MIHFSHSLHCSMSQQRAEACRRVFTAVHVCVYVYVYVCMCMCVLRVCVCMCVCVCAAAQKVSAPLGTAPRHTTSALRRVCISVLLCVCVCVH